jgi:hypothetical protein
MVHVFTAKMRYGIVVTCYHLGWRVLFLGSTSPSPGSPSKDADFSKTQKAADSLVFDVPSEIPGVKRKVTQMGIL